MAELRAAEPRLASRVREGMCGVCGRDSPPAIVDQWNALMSGATTGVLIAEDGGRTVGAVVASSDGWRAYI